MRRPGRVAVVANAMDAAPADVRAAAVELELAALAGLGLQPVELDLRAIGDASSARAALAGYELVWLRGGNVFVLRHALAKSGADAALVDLVRGDSLVYAGYSAGPGVLAPSLRGLEHCDDAGEVERVFGASPTYEGLGVLPFAFVPHVQSPGHPENEVARRYESAGTPHVVLRDGQALVVDGDPGEYRLV